VSAFLMLVNGMVIVHAWLTLVCQVYSRSFSSDVHYVDVDPLGRL